MNLSGLNTIEKKAAFSLATIFGLRMLGLFMILPVFAIYGVNLTGYSPTLLGLAIGAYGLTQAVLQIPMGLLSDKFGRKPIIFLGLIVFLIGSLVAANSTSIYGVIFGRALQGMGAIASAILALAADLSREEQRPKVMAIIGMLIGLSFMVAMVLGPIVAQYFGLSGLFYFIAILTVLAIFMVWLLVPNSLNKAPKGDSVASIHKLKELSLNGQLMLLNFGVFILHMALTAIFICLPKLLINTGFNLGDHWQLYLSAMLGAFILMMPFMIWAIKKQQERTMLIAAVALITTTLLMVSYLPPSLSVLSIFVLLFFVGFNYLEATMPTVLSRLAPAGVKGSVMGIYSSWQFLGAFTGGVLGGILIENYSDQSIFMVMGIFCLLWFLLSFKMQKIAISKSYSFKVTIKNEEQTETIIDTIINMHGVQEITLMSDEMVAYLKLNAKQADIPLIKSMLQPD